MFIENIKLNNFRNIDKVNIDFSKKLNFIIGNNGQGKTNFVEAIYVSSFLKSFRTHKINNIIKIDKNYFNIKLNVLKNSVSNELSFYVSKNEKRILLNNKIPDRNNFYKFLNVVIFHPEEINYISSYPVFRRNLIDRSIFYTNYNYIDTYRKYFNCLKQRNSFLKKNINVYDSWLDQLIKYGSYIISERLNYIERINNIFNKSIYKNISKENYLISYSKKYSNIDHIQDYLREDFIRNQDRERLLGYTLVGPHKDDIRFYLNGKSADIFASQGQKRSLIILFKTAQILDYKTVQGHYPVLILDDMASELDRNRKNSLLDNLLENSGQVFITSTDFEKNNIFEQTKIFTVNDGVISVAD